MKRVNLWMIGIGLSLSAGLLAAEPGYADKGDSPKCTLATLKGRYLFGGIATLLPPVSGDPSLLAVAGYHIFNGDGTGTDIVTFRVNGVTVLENEVVPISYTVNADCTGSYTVLIPDGPSFGIFIAPNGESIATIATAPPGNQGSSIARRVSRK